MESSRRDRFNDMAEHRSILKSNQKRATPLLFKIGLCSDTSMESSRRDLMNDMAEHRSILKNNQITYYHRFSFTPKTGIAFPKTSVFTVLGFIFILNKI